MTYVYLGYGITDSTGKCVLDHDANGNTLTHSYTGTGAGKIDIVASLDSTLTDNSTLSNICTITDCSSHDTGTDSTFNQYYLSANTVTRTVDNTGTLFENTGTSTAYAFLLPPDTTATSAATACVYTTGDYAIECDIEAYTGTVNIEIRGATGNLISRRFNQLTENTAFRLRLTVIDGKGRYYIDDSTTPAYTSSAVDLSTTLGVRLSVSAGGTVKIKNFKIYPI